MSGKTPVALIILDGWGIAPDDEYNAVTRADTPFLDSLFKEYPNTQLKCYGTAVGLPTGQMGNSEVGHLNLGSGRVVNQDFTRINLAVEDSSLFDNPELTIAMDRARDNQGTLHLMGLLSDGGVHSSLKHLYALIRMAHDREVPHIAIHAFLDGRDAPPDSGADFLEQLQTFLAPYPRARVATVGGRFWGMDRDKRWDRVEKHYAAIVRGEGRAAGDPVDYVRQCYTQKEFDEFIIPAVVISGDSPLEAMKDGDAAIFFNFRADRARELTWALNQPDFDGFDVSGSPALSYYVCMTRYDERLDIPVAFPPNKISGTLAELVSRAGMKQLHIAETEKYAHVTFFFNGGLEDPFPGEDRALIDSPREVNTYDEKPQMSAYGVTDEVVTRIESGKYGFIVMNYANGDMVGHTGVFSAAREAVGHLDKCLAQVIPVVLNQGGAVILTADHGNSEQMFDPKTGGPYTAHTISNPVPCILIDADLKDAVLHQGALRDVAPTILSLLGLPPGQEMTGRCLFQDEEPS